jgi:hypothetical protein
MMGNKTYQRILTCSICNKTPDDGEPLWEMITDFWCETCIDYMETSQKDEDANPIEE